MSEKIKNLVLEFQRQEGHGLSRITQDQVDNFYRRLFIHLNGIEKVLEENRAHNVLVLLATCVLGVEPEVCKNAFENTMNTLHPSLSTRYRLAVCNTLASGIVTPKDIFGPAYTKVIDETKHDGGVVVLLHKPKGYFNTDRDNFFRVAALTIGQSI